MILEDNFRQDFYNKIKKDDKSLVLIVSVDSDALCTTMILTHLLKCDDIPFTILTVEKWSEVEKIFETKRELRCNYILINCGATRSLSRLQISPDSTAYVLDSHRPFHIENVYANEKVHLLVNNSEMSELQLPDVEKVIQEDSDDDEDNEENRGSYEQQMENIRRKAIKREEMQAWERQRQRTLWKYYESTWFSTPSCVTLLELAAEMNRVSAEIMWYTAVGLNSAMVDKLISIEMYTQICVDRMRPFVHRFLPKNIINQGKVDDLLHITFGRELPLAIYSHWDLYNSMWHNEYFSIKTKNWTQKGDTNIRHLLTQLGVTLHETTQKFESLSTEQRIHVVDLLEKEMDSAFATFFATLGYSGKLSACDVARAVTVRLEMPRSETLMDRYRAGQAILRSSITGERQERTNLTHTISSNCQRTLQVSWKSVSAAINMSEIIANGPYYLFSCTTSIDEDMIDSRHFLYNTTGFMLRAFASMRKGRTSKPLIAMFPLTGESAGWLVVTGVMPIATIYEDSLLKTCIGRAFERVKKTNSSIRIIDDSFNPDIIRLKSEDRTRFIDLLRHAFEGD
ncbi:hypothetical protein CRE_25146 [Caenorhabditis remanei]|uniref:Uncharacterized protein n=1 Tax=Caenorhabditis remanei TaxID=31234 RepID=E3LT62_CAERE|nr:hypothetical protein CRE_25146 [Caenorhabditis remanei]